MKITKLGKALSNDTRTNILKLLATGSHPSIETFERYNETYEEEKQRETIYRELENLVEVGLVAKEYNETAGQIEYRLRQQQLLVDLGDGTVKEMSD